MSPDLPPLIRALLDPRCYPDPAVRVELKQTHLSWLLLAGTHVFKIRKPVQFDFVDFSTLELRRRDCEAEVRLNRSFAPTLYEGVVAITGSIERPVLGGSGSALEYAVQMRRFAAQDELTTLLTANAVSTDELAQFGARIADIHAASPVHDGPASLLIDVARENAQELARVAGSDDRIAHLQRWLEATWSRIADLADERCRAGRVRECHGDLHAANIVRLDGVLTAFDAITFNTRLRCIDVASDIAFLIMDLHAGNRPQLAWAFVNGWLERSGDYQAVQLLAFTVVHRALVRAKVAVLDNDRDRCEKYLALAEDSTRAGPGALTITCGLSGSGKTWLSTRVMTEAAAVRIRSDVERKRLAGLRAEQSSRGGPSIYTVEFNAQVYEHLLALTRDLLRCGAHVIVDAAFLRRAERHSFMQLAAAEGVAFNVLHCVAATNELRRRLDRRQRAGGDASEADATVMQRQLDYWEAFDESELPFVHEVRTADESRVNELVSDLRKHLRA